MSSDIGNLGEEMHSWASDLFPICRSLTGQGNRDTLAYIKNIIPELEMYSVATGYQAFDWCVPNEWNILGGYIYYFLLLFFQQTCFWYPHSTCWRQLSEC